MTSALIILLAVAWFLQLLLSLWQTRRFYRRLAALRRSGQCAVGMDGSIYRTRTYVVLVTNEQGIISHAEKLSGWTVFAGLRPVPGLVGMHLSSLLDEEEKIALSKKDWQAFCNAAKDLQSALEDVSVPDENALVSSTQA